MDASANHFVHSGLYGKPCCKMKQGSLGKWMIIREMLADKVRSCFF